MEGMATDRLKISKADSVKPQKDADIIDRFLFVMCFNTVFSLLRYQSNFVGNNSIDLP